MQSTPLGDGFRMPAEWSPHERTLMAWPARRALWGDRLTEAYDVYASIAHAIAEYEPVTMVADPADAEIAIDACGPRIEVIEIPIDDSWVRDSGPIGVVAPDGARAAVDFIFNGWGRKFPPWGHDDALAHRLADQFHLPRYRAPFVLEGGAVTVDGEGTAIVTEQCLLHPNRNPSLTRRQIEQGLADYLGIERVIWIPFGLAGDDDTDGHVDNVACFTAPGAVLVQGCDDPSDQDHNRLAINGRCLDGALDACGREIHVTEIPVLPNVATSRGRRPVPYLNLYVANGAVVVPVAGDPADDEALAVIGDRFPGRAVVSMPGAVLAHGGGGIHCITQQLPSAGAHSGVACS
jgi:agmatine deiminase